MRLRSQRALALVSLTLLILLLAMAGSALATRPNTLNRDEIPDKYKWDLGDIYADWEAWEEGFAKLEKMMDEFASLEGTISGGPENLLKAFKLDDELNLLLYKVYRYPALMNVTDTRNNDIAARFQQIQILYSKFGVATSWFNPELLSIPWETMKKWLDESEGLKPYRFNVENLYRVQEHVLDEDKEQLLSLFSRFNGTPGSIYQELSTSDIQYPDVTLSDGETVTMTSGRYYDVLTNYRSQEDRGKAFENYYSVYDATANTYAAIYNGILQRDWGQAQARNYGSCLEAALNGDNVPVDVYKNLIKTVREGKAPAQRYYELRKKVLGVDTYHGYDGHVPFVDFNKKYDYDEITNWIVECVKPLGKDFQNKTKRIYGNRWVDVYENEGKTSGAFQAGVAGVHPYILMNYTETMDNVYTLAHESGHTVHTLLSEENQPFATSDYTIFVAEVPSAINEMHMMDYMLEHSDDPLEKVTILQRAIDDILGTFYAQTMFAEFEMRAHEMVEQGQPITAKSLSDMYEELWQAYDGPAIYFDSLYRSTWTRISHFYEAPYYVYKYATSFAAAAKIYKDLKSDDKQTRKETLDRYLTLLKSGGNDYPMEQLKKAGVDLSDPENFRAVVAHLDGLVTKLENELKKLNVI